MSEITREYLEKIDFRIDYAKNYEVQSAFAWIGTHEGFDYWFIEEGDGLTPEGSAKIDEMIRVWEATEPQPEAPAIEYCITAGEGRLIDYGVVTTEKKFQSRMTDWKRFGVTGGTVHAGSTWSVLDIAPTTTSCMTGK